MAGPAASIASSSRVIRVFVSSTFRDMEAERDELVKRTFPQLRKLCEARGVTWGEVDLRWGVTDEQKSEGKVLPICLAEIRRCRPYFIGLLGERYGWVPEEISPALLDEERWLGGLQGRSVTELEILQGVLNNPAMAEHAFFYLRSPAYLDSLPREQRSAFQECSTPEDIAQFGAEEAARRAEVRKQKLALLKERIRGSGLPIRENYSDPRSLREMVLADLTSVIDRVFPEGSAPGLLDREAAEHEAFAQSRAHVYIGRAEYFARLDAHAEGDGPPLVVLGESGSGKSALLANWAMRYRVAHPDDLLVEHFIGATPASADWAAMLRRILGEFKRCFGLTLEIPDKPDALRMAFANALHMAAAKGRVVVILDALNQLEERDQAPDLVWLPPVIPGKVRLILSTLPGRPLDDLRKRDWPILQVEPLTTLERKQLVNEYLAQYTKSLSPVRVERIAEAPQTANPLYLRALLEELRLWHEHETLEERIDHYLSAATVAELYQRILDRYEQDYERDRPNLVRDAMSLLWAARRGLSEAELMDLLGEGGEPLPSAYWSPLYLAAEQSLVNRSGLIGFFHDYIRNAIVHRYLSDERERCAAHARLAGYFAERATTSRKLDELPWQQAKGQLTADLRDTLTDLSMIEYAVRAGNGSWHTERKYEWANYWRFVDDPRLAGDLYQKSLADFVKREGESIRASTLASIVADLLMVMGLYSQAQLVAEAAARILYSRVGPCDPSYIASLSNLAQLCKLRGRFSEALPLFEQALRLLDQGIAVEDLTRASIMNNLAQVYCALGDVERGAELAERALELREQCLGRDHALVATSLDNLGKIHQQRGDLARAARLHERALEIFTRNFGSTHVEVATCLSNLAHLYHTSGQTEKAGDSYRRALAIYESVLGEEHDYTATVLNNLGGLHHSEANYPDAIFCYQRALRILDKIYGGEHPSTARTLDNLASVFIDLGDLHEARALEQQALTIAIATLGAGHPVTAQYRSNLELLHGVLH